MLQYLNYENFRRLLGEGGGENRTLCKRERLEGESEGQGQSRGEGFAFLSQQDQSNMRVRPPTLLRQVGEMGQGNDNSWEEGVTRGVGLGGEGRPIRTSAAQRGKTFHLQCTVEEHKKNDLKKRGGQRDRSRY